MHKNNIEKTMAKRSWVNFSLLSGFILAAMISVIAIYLGQLEWFSKMGIGTLTLAILLGIMVGNSFYPLAKPMCETGIIFSKHYLLRAGIILYGFRLTFQQITDVGVTAVLIDALTLTSTLLFCYWLGRKIFKLDRETTILIGAGSSICGAAAIMATEPIVRAEANKVAIAVSTVVIFGTIAIFIYPWLYQLNVHFQWLQMSQTTFGIYAGSTVHEVAQVVAIGHSIGLEAENAAVIAKMIRVMMLAPFLIVISTYLSRKHVKQADVINQRKITIPWFAIIFILMVGFNSLRLLPQQLVSYLIQLDTILLTMAMVALGLTTNINAIRQTGAKPLLIALLIFLWLIIGGLAINIVVESIFN